MKKGAYCYNLCHICLKLFFTFPNTRSSQYEAQEERIMATLVSKPKQATQCQAEEERIMATLGLKRKQATKRTSESGKIKKK